ncbi:MAG: hypothetical protein AA908_04595 [Chlorobi bacterium NICIL-2]|nr:MAG: hypothetical protein AA908_04595 [Chlorobi bacterium NICIL-2]
MRTFADAFLHWYESLRFPEPVPEGIEVLDPRGDERVRRAVRAFARRYYGDRNPRIGVFGINPGRFGAGVTGIIFTDPVALRHECGIPNDLGERRELSGTFVYRTIAAFGGPEAFYARFYLSALSPLGFVRNGKNLNFYDDSALEAAAREFIVESLRAQKAFPLRREVAIILGSGKLRTIAEQLNALHRFFDRLLFLEHPRYVAQYRRREMDHYVERYVRTYHEALTICGMQ